MGTLGQFHLILGYCHLSIMTLADMYIIFPTFSNCFRCVTAVYYCPNHLASVPHLVYKNPPALSWTPMIEGYLHLDESHIHPVYYSSTLLWKEGTAITFLCVLCEHREHTSALLSDSWVPLLLSLQPLRALREPGARRLTAFTVPSLLPPTAPGPHCQRES